MAFRTLVISTHCKLEYSLEYLVYRGVDTTKRIFLNEINTILIESTQVSITTSLLNEIVKRKIKLIFCDEKHDPSSELVPYNNSHNSSERIMNQINWDDETKDLIWQQIIKEKINTEYLMLKKYNHLDVALQVYDYMENVEIGDLSNREGHAAKVYFNNIFYKNFSRNENSVLNASLNYGYTLILSQFNRIVVGSGYLTQLGIHHKGQFNPFNFSCDLMEPFRYIVDQFAIKIYKENLDFKKEMMNLLSINLVINGREISFFNALSIYFSSVIEAITKKKPTLIKFTQFYEL